MSESSLHEKTKTDSAYSTKRDHRTKDVYIAQLKRASGDTVHLRLDGVDHTARPTWKLKETVEFYRDSLGLPLVHSVSARGWGTGSHPDFLPFFFDSGQGSTIAFFYYLNSDAPETLRGRSKMRPAPDDHVFDANHTAW